MSFAEGHCDCREVRYRVTSAPMFVHCCQPRTPGESCSEAVILVEEF